MKKIAIALALLCNTPVLAHSYTEKDVQCLATNIYHEARGESTIGQMAVALVTINRAKSSIFPYFINGKLATKKERLNASICDVVYDSKRDRRGKVVLNKCQFSWYCDGKSDVIKNKKVYNKILHLSRNVLTNYYNWDYTNGSVYYNTTAIKRGKGFTKTVKIQNHVFYK